MDEKIFPGHVPYGRRSARGAAPVLPLDRRLAGLNAEIGALARCRGRELVLIGALANLCGELDQQRVIEETVHAAAALADAACAGLVLPGSGPAPRTWTWAGPDVDGGEAVDLEHDVLDAVTGNGAAASSGRAPAEGAGSQVLLVPASGGPAPDGEPVGWLWVAVPRSGTFEADDAESLSILAGAAGRALAAVRRWTVLRRPRATRLGMARPGDDLTVGDLG
jgi:hypothetical protein